MPFPTSRRMRLSLLACLFLFACIATPTLARSPYEMADALEGDPGDGVLNPRLGILDSGGKPLTGGDKAVSEKPASPVIYDIRSLRGLRIILPYPVQGWFSPSPVWLVFEGRWTHAP